MLHIRRTDAGEARATVEAVGQVDLATAPKLAEVLERVLEEGPPEMTVDIAGVDFLDSAGVGVLVEAAREAAAEAVPMSVRGAHGWVARVLEITGLEGYLHLVPPEPDQTADSDQ
jgi:anti-anti-sigma factor